MITGGFTTKEKYQNMNLCEKERNIDTSSSKISTMIE